MDVHCTTCGEPWDTYHLLHDAIWETGMEEETVTDWRALPSEKRLSARYRDAFKDAGYEFGRSVLNVTRCPACPPNATPDPETVFLKAEIESMLVRDDDGLASTFSEYGL